MKEWLDVLKATLVSLFFPFHSSFIIIIFACYFGCWVLVWKICFNNAFRGWSVYCDADISGCLFTFSVSFQKAEAAQGIFLVILILNSPTPLNGLTFCINQTTWS